MSESKMCLIAAILPVVLAGCSTPGGSSGATASASPLASCNLPDALAGKQWNVRATVKDPRPPIPPEYYDKPQVGDVITATCEPGIAGPRVFIHFESASHQKHFEDFSDIPLRYFQKGVLLDAGHALRFEDPHGFARYIQEVTRDKHDYLVGSGLLRSGRPGNPPVAVIALVVPWTSMTAADGTRENLTVLLANLDEIPWTGATPPTTPTAPGTPTPKQGGVIHGRK